MLSDSHVHILDPNDKEKVQVMPGTAKDCLVCTPVVKPYNKPGPKPKSHDGETE
jgi:hypothetical protein